MLCRANTKQIDTFTISQAARRLSGIITPASAAYSASELTHRLRSSGAKALLTCTARLETALQAAKDSGIPQDRIFILSIPGDRKVPFATLNDLVREGVSLPVLEPLVWEKWQGARQVAYLCYSSGTSGLPVSELLALPPFSAVTPTIATCITSSNSLGRRRS